MNIRYVAFDSFGVKSSCTALTTKDCNIVIDPGIASETSSFPLSGSERTSLSQRYGEKMRSVCSNSEIVVLTHYHYDHYLPDQGMYESKTILIKHPREYINRSQKKRASALLDGLDAQVEFADGKEFSFGSTDISFSEPQWHGVEGTNLGYVIMVTVQDDDKKVLYTSDIDGPIQEKTVDLIIDENPDVLIVDGPPTYLLGYIVAYYNLAISVVNMCRIIDETNTKLIVIDHHLLRDYRYKDLFYEVYNKAKKSNRKVCSAAEVMGKTPMVLEGYTKNGTTRWKNWRRFEKKDIISVLENATENGLIDIKWLESAYNL